MFIPRPRFGFVLALLGLIIRPLVGPRIFAVTALTWKAAFRSKLFVALSVLLLGSVVLLPLLLKDDGTAAGFTQILLTYTLATVTFLLGFSTLWLACGTMARDVEECQVQMVAVKPIARWQIWFGKWLGIMLLNTMLLAQAGLCIFLLLQWRAQKLPQAEQVKLRNEVLVARASVKEANLDAEIEAEAERRLAERLKQTQVTQADLQFVRQQIIEQVKAQFQIVAPNGGYRPWLIDLGGVKDSLKGQPLYLRVKFLTADNSSSGAFGALWQVGVPETPRLWRSELMSLAPDTFHEFQIPADLFDDKGMLTIFFVNPNNVAVLFQLEDGMQVLYRDGGFGSNFVRGLGVILCWMALLAALGLAAASFLSFPVAAFCSVAFLVIGLSSSTLSNVVAEGTVMGVNEESGVAGRSVIDLVAVPLFGAMLKVINLVQNFSPIDALSTGRSITWSELGRAFAQIVLLMGGIISLFGIVVFSRRELATAQGTQ